MSHWQTVSDAIGETEILFSAVDAYGREMTNILARRPEALRRAKPDDLRKLKRALREFDMTTGHWKR